MVMYIFVLAVQYLLNIQYLYGGFHEVVSQFVACIFCRLSCLYLKCLIYYMNIQCHYLLLPTIHKLNVKKNEVNNSFDSILDEDVRYSIQSQSKILPLKRRGGYDQSVCNIFFVFFMYIIYSIRSIRKSLKFILLLIQKKPPEVLCEKRCYVKFR